MSNLSRVGRVCLLAFLFVAYAHGQSIEQRGSAYVVDGTLEASAGQPRIHVQLSRNGKALVGKSLLNELDLGLEDIIGEQGDEHSFMAYLDTGASAYVLSPVTAERFGVTPENGAVFHEVGVSGEVAMDISQPYAIALAESNGMINDRPDNGFTTISNRAVLQVKRADPNAAANPLAAQMMLGEINIIGMPAIEKFVVEIDTRPMISGLQNLKIDENAALDLDALLDGLGGAGVGPAVKLHPLNVKIPRADLIVPLKLVDYNRRNNPRDRGPLPDLASNPVLDSVVTQSNGKTFTGDWLLDTGAAASIISTRHAMSLGLMDAAGEALKPVAFQLTLGGVSGKTLVADGFVIDRLTVACQGGRQLVYTNAHVIVHDVSIQLDNGKFHTLDGVFGLNLTMPTMGGLAGGLPNNVANAPFSRIVIDTVNRRIHLTFNRP